MLNNWLPVKSASSSEQSPKSEKGRRIEQTTKALELCFRKKSIVDLLVYRIFSFIPFAPP